MAPDCDQFHEKSVVLEPGDRLLVYESIFNNHDPVFATERMRKTRTCLSGARLVEAYIKAENPLEARRAVSLEFCASCDDPPLDLVSIITRCREMSHFAARFGSPLAVEMKTDSGDSQHVVPVGRCSVG